MVAFMVIKKAPALSSGGPVPLRLNLAAGWLDYSKTDAVGARGLSNALIIGDFSSSTADLANGVKRSGGQTAPPQVCAVPAVGTVAHAAAE